MDDLPHALCLVIIVEMLPAGRYLAADVIETGAAAPGTMQSHQV